jgi:CRP/FNR family transcriptional regulator
MSNLSVLRSVPLFAALSDGELARLHDRLGRRTFGKHVIIFHKDSPGQSLYIIKSGAVRIFLLSESGQEISVDILVPGDIFGELAVLDGRSRSAGALTLEETVVLTLPRDSLWQCLEESPSMTRAIMEVICGRLRYTTAYAESLAFLDVHSRVAAKLVELADRYGVDSGPGKEIELRLTQAELASWVATTRESVNKVLCTFRDQELIELEGQRITVLDRRGLKNRIVY